MNKLTFVSIAVVVLLILNGGLIAFIFFQERHKPPRNRADEVIVDRLQLNEEQIGRFEELKRIHRREVMQCHDSIGVLKRTLMNGLRTSSPDHNAAAEVSTAIARKQKEIELATFRHFAALRELCDDRQKKLFDEFIQEIARALDRPHPPGKKTPG